MTPTEATRGIDLWDTDPIAYALLARAIEVGGSLKVNQTRMRKQFGPALFDSALRVLAEFNLVKTRTEDGNLRAYIETPRPYEHQPPAPADPLLVEIIDHYRATIRPAGDAVLAFENLLTAVNAGHAPARLLQAVDRYAAHLRETNAKKFAVSVQRFFSHDGVAFYFTPFLPTEKAPAKAINRDIAALKGA